MNHRPLAALGLSALLASACISVADRPAPSGDAWVGQDPGGGGGGGNCTTGAKRCVDGTEEHCVDGNWVTQKGCKTGEICAGGECLPEFGNGSCYDAYFCTLRCADLPADEVPACSERCYVAATAKAQGDLDDLVACWEREDAGCEGKLGCVTLLCAGPLDVCWDWPSTNATLSCAEIDACVTQECDDHGATVLDAGYAECVLDKCSSRGRYPGAQVPFMGWLFCWSASCLSDLGVCGVQERWDACPTLATQCTNP